MALLKCTDCQHQISSKASQCPHCGYPLTNDEHAVTIQQTSKKYKDMYLLSIFMFWGSLFLLGTIGLLAHSAILSSIIGLVGFSGIALYLYSRFGSWYNHA